MTLFHSFDKVSSTWNLICVCKLTKSKTLHLAKLSWRASVLKMQLSYKWLQNILNKSDQLTVPSSFRQPSDKIRSQRSELWHIAKGGNQFFIHLNSLQENLLIKKLIMIMEKNGRVVHWREANSREANLKQISINDK